jgi:hypothetical protein
MAGQSQQPAAGGRGRGRPASSAHCNVPTCWQGAAWPPWHQRRHRRAAAAGPGQGRQDPGACCAAPTRQLPPAQPSTTTPSWPWAACACGMLRRPPSPATSCCARALPAAAAGASAAAAMWSLQVRRMRRRGCLAGWQISVQGLTVPMRHVLCGSQPEPGGYLNRTLLHETCHVQAWRTEASAAGTCQRQAAATPGSRWRAAGCQSGGRPTPPKRMPCQPLLMLTRWWRWQPLLAAPAAWMRPPAAR